LGEVDFARDARPITGFPLAGHRHSPHFAIVIAPSSRNAAPAAPRGASRVRDSGAHAAPRRTPYAVWYALAWVPLVVAYIGALTWMSGGTLPVASVAFAAVVHTLGPALLGAAVWWLTGRLGVPSPLTVRFVAAHFAGATVFLAAWTAYELALLQLLAPLRGLDPMFLRYAMPWQGFLGVMLYGVVAGIGYAVRGVMNVHRLEMAAATAERLRAEAELAALRAHLDPHFLFNTLHGVMQLLRDEPERAERALERLADLLRFVLHLDRLHARTITLEAEWEFVQSFLWLEQMRLGDRLTVDAEVDDDAMACTVPPFTLQPLVENALRHGIAPRPEGGTVTIRARNADDRLYMEVADDGVGAAEVPGEATPGLGLQAVVRRLRSQFGDAAVDVNISTAPGRGFRVKLALPAVTAGADARILQ
jgi:signal transduction histidine kinase